MAMKLDEYYKKNKRVMLKDIRTNKASINQIVARLQEHLNTGFIGFDNKTTLEFISRDLYRGF